MRSPVQVVGDRIIGTVEEVSADRITVLLDPDAPQATALNTGTPIGFPRINGYVLIPNESGATACVVSSVQIARLPFPKRKGMEQDFGLVDLPFPSRLMSLTPLGTLKSHSEVDSVSFKIRRGVDVFPSVGDPVLLADTEQLKAIVEGETQTTRRILIGYSPIAGRVPVYVDPDKLFGRHLAVLGNTGAGKSCSVAGLVRWSLEAARNAPKESAAIEPGDSKRNQVPNARFIVLDPNGEYAHAFKDLKVRVFHVDPHAEGKPLKVPAWLWNAAEWAAFTEAAPGVQRPLLLRALRRLRGTTGIPNSFESRVISTLHSYRNIFQIAHSTREYLRFPAMKNVRIALESAEKEFNELLEQADKQQHSHADTLRAAKTACESAAKAGVDKSYDQAIDATFIQEVLKSIDNACNTFGVPDTNEIDENIPKEFNIASLPMYVEALAGLMPGRDLAQFVDTLSLRIRSLLSQSRLASILKPENPDPITLESWLTDYIGADQAENGPIAAIDLSLVPSEVTHIVVSVLARMIFEALQRYRRENDEELPTTLVLEEAHTFVHRDLAGEAASPASRACAREFERIAREGRKFGLGLVLASQRPSEVSSTVLSQCNTFLLHRLVNDRDQELVKRLVPDGLGPLLRELPSLPTRRAILLGWAAPAPTLVEVQEIPEKFRPHSPDPAFWDVWTGKQERSINWKKIAQVWQTGDREHTSDQKG